MLYWGPTAEGEFGQERFLEDHPLKLATSGQFTKVPFLSGITTDEFADKAFSEYLLRTIMNSTKTFSYRFSFKYDSFGNVGQGIREIRTDYIFVRKEYGKFEAN